MGFFGGNKPSSREKKHELERPDWFEASLQPIFDWLEKNLKLVGIAFIALVLAGAGAMGLAEKQKRAEAEAQSALHLALQQLDKDREEIANTLSPKKDSSEKKEANAIADEQKKAEFQFARLEVDEKYKSSLGQLREVSESHSGTHAAFEAQLQVGNLYFQHGQVDRSFEHFSKALDMAQRPLDRASVLLGLAYAHEELGQCDQSLLKLDEGLGLGVSWLKGELLLAKARCLGELKRKDEAVAVYEQIETELPDSQYARSAEVLKTAVQ